MTTKRRIVVPHTERQSLCVVKQGIACRGRVIDNTIQAFRKKKMNQNPYQSPSPATPGASFDTHGGELMLVSQGKRFINYLVDRVLMTTGSFCVGIMLGLLVGATDPERRVVDDGMLEALGFIVGLLFVYCYFVFFEAVFQRSPGKFLTGTKVVNESGGKPTFGQILGRSLCRFIPFEAFSFLFGDSSRVVGWHDKFSGTLVVKS